MYSGIIHGHYPITVVKRQPGLLTFAVEFPPSLIENLKLGASVAIDGVCQTVSKIAGQQVFFDAMQETLDKTTLGYLQLQDSVNVERSLRYGDENGGHELSGHVDGRLSIVDIEQLEHNHILTLQVPPNYRKYIFNKGFLAIHGASLTVSDYQPLEGLFKVYLTPETLRLTNLGHFKKGDELNFEIDRRSQVIVDTVENYLSQRPAA
ncbi:riboflavin synthase subunit alpha [Celerinatantimonas diazotrophica]|uniref:Riboflavin synthase n=1 Tax=Celerinatantimonas diazotrophica TaxID=412034 RepID=A0A4R1K4P0_9GAMM|nr:riboflavin synthase subunit alpha [Celerinatantimonas diazotrophica]TCK59098.1 riboflavin synthase alpha chain [Celerinatantimonas diazotrophica]CAG9297736.1 Riboflavin synthase [Celerinatantimonas diazotrophica]